MSGLWRKVVFLIDCYYEDEDVDRENPIFPICRSFYDECDCPGPMDDELDYKIVNNEMFAKIKTENE